MLTGRDSLRTTLNCFFIKLFKACHNRHGDNHPMMDLPITYGLFSRNKNLGFLVLTDFLCGMSLHQEVVQQPTASDYSQTFEKSLKGTNSATTIIVCYKQNRNYKISRHCFFKLHEKQYIYCCWRN
jgi:hypothetical protein